MSCLRWGIAVVLLSTALDSSPSGAVAPAAPVSVEVVERTQTCVLVGEASISGDVDHEADLALVVGECDRVAGDRLHLELVEDSHGHSFVIVNGSS